MLVSLSKAYFFRYVYFKLIRQRAAFTERIIRQRVSCLHREDNMIGSNTSSLWSLGQLPQLIYSNVLCAKYVFPCHTPSRLVVLLAIVQFSSHRDCLIE